MIIAPIDEMKDTVRDSVFGQLVRFVTNDRHFQYVEETAQFRLPYRTEANSDSEEVVRSEALDVASASISVGSVTPKQDGYDTAVPNLEKAETNRETELNYLERILSRDMQAPQHLITIKLSSRRRLQMARF
jgi:hypothetical protein